MLHVKYNGTIYSCPVPGKQIHEYTSFLHKKPWNIILHAFCGTNNHSTISFFLYKLFYAQSLYDMVLGTHLYGFPYVRTSITVPQKYQYQFQILTSKIWNQSLNLLGWLLSEKSIYLTIQKLVPETHPGLHWHRKCPVMDVRGAILPSQRGTPWHSQNIFRLDPHKHLGATTIPTHQRYLKYNIILAI